ncbi:DNA replication licensing factor MCM2 [Diplonema papillatum]|nr:DNA replication licensing factor MCM2 [Diplonema papillatum]
MAFRDDGSSVSSSEKDGEDLDDANLWNKDVQEMEAELNAWEDDSMLVDDDKETSEGDSLDTEKEALLDLKIARGNKRRKRAEQARQELERLDTETVITDSDTDTRAGQSEKAKAGPRPAAGNGAADADDSDTDSSSDGSASDDDNFDRINLQDPKAIPREWLKQERVVREVKKQFRRFIRGFTDPGGARVYQAKIQNLVQNQQESLIVDFQDMARFNVGLAVLAGEAPSVTLKIFDEIAGREVFREYPAYRRISPEIHIRLVNLPLSDAIRNLRCLHMNMLTMIHGVVTRRSLVYPQLQAVKYDCLSCGYIIGPLMLVNGREARVRQCPSCQKPGPFRLNSLETRYRNYQTAILQESPGTVPPGRLPRWIEVILTDDLVDIARPGDEIQVTGIYRNNFDPLLNHRQGFPVFTTVLEANAVRKRVDDLREATTDEERTEIRHLAQHPNVVEKICASICPSIHGNEIVKAGIACSLFGGVPKEVGDGKHRIRGDINVLLVGDPGCAKSQFLKYVEKTSSRAVFTTGKGSTAVGLTAAVHKDSMTGEWTLEGGAMVIADKGHCLIDEFDKMSDQDRTSIHEAMEQQTISIAKAGIVTSLQARCSIIAAANPIMGHYDSTQSFESQVNLTQPILSRFDLLFAIRDTIDAVKDTHLARFVLNSHMRHHPSVIHGADLELLDGVPEVSEDRDPATSNPLPQKFLQRYILYARSCVQPRLEQVDIQRLVKFYVDLRDDSHMSYDSGVKIVVRHLESICRLSEAYAKMRLSPYVREDDVNRAIALFLNAFMSTLPYKRREAIKKKYNHYLVMDKQNHQILNHLLEAMVKEHCHIMSLKFGGYQGRDVTVTAADLKSKATEHKIYEKDVEKFFKTKPFLASYELINNRHDILWKKDTQPLGINIY